MVITTERIAGREAGDRCWEEPPTVPCGFTLPGRSVSGADYCEEVDAGCFPFDGDARAYISEELAEVAG